MPFEECGKNGSKDAESRYSTAHRADPDEFVFWSVHDHPYGGNGARARAGRAQERGRGLHVHGDRAGREQVGAFGAADDVVRAGQRSPVDGASGQGAGEFLHQPVGADAPDRPARVPGLLGDDEVAGVHAGGESRAEARGQHGGAVERRVGQDPGDRALGRPGSHAGTQDGDRPAGAGAVAGAQGEVLDAERAGDQQRGRAGPRGHQLPFTSAVDVSVAGRAAPDFWAKGSPCTYRPSAVSGKTCR